MNASDPLLYHLEWDVALEVLFTIIVLSFLVERALSLLFEHRLYDSKFGGKGLSEPIALVVSVLVARHCEFDALAILMRLSENHWLGYLVTGGIVAGGSKASIKLFHDLLDIRSTYDRRKEELMQQGMTRKQAAEQAARETRTTKETKQEQDVANQTNERAKTKGTTNQSAKRTDPATEQPSDNDGTQQATKDPA